MGFGVGTYGLNFCYDFLKLFETFLKIELLDLELLVFLTRLTKGIGLLLLTLHFVGDFEEFMQIFLLSCEFVIIWY